MIFVKGLSKSLSKTPVLKNITFHVEQGTIFCLVGPSGAGKTTLFRCLAGLLTPDQGSIEGRFELGIVFQHCPLLSSQTVLANVALPLILKGENHEAALDALDQVGMLAFKDRYPAALSGGQKQKVALARAIVTKPTVLLLDEPSSSLDPKSVKELQELLLSLNKQGLTIIIITHEMDLVRSLAHHVAVIDWGEIVETGPLTELFGNPRHPVTQSLLERWTC